MKTVLYLLLAAFACLFTSCSSTQPDPKALPPAHRGSGPQIVSRSTPGPIWNLDSFPIRPGDPVPWQRSLVTGGDLWSVLSFCQPFKNGDRWSLRWAVADSINDPAKVITWDTPIRELGGLSLREGIYQGAVIPYWDGKWTSLRILKQAPKATTIKGRT